MHHHTQRLIEAAQAEADRLSARVQELFSALDRDRAALREIESFTREIRDLELRRRQLIEHRWKTRRTVRELRAVADSLIKFTLPHRAGGVRALARTRAAELANTLWRRAAPVHASLGKSGVYALFDGNELVYIGQAEHVLERIAQHLRSKTFTHAAYISCPVSELDALERALLDVYAPPLNKDSTTIYLRKRVQRNFLPKPHADGLEG